MTLIELLAAIPAMAVVATVTAGVILACAQTAPRAQRAVDADRTVSIVVGQIRKDVDRARSLPAAADGRQAGEDLLLLDWPDRLVCYRVEPGQVVREDLPREPNAAIRPKAVWPAPAARIAFDRQGGGAGATGQAVGVRTAIECIEGGKTVARLARTHVLFVGSLGAQEGMP